MTSRSRASRSRLSSLEKLVTDSREASSVRSNAPKILTAAFVTIAFLLCATLTPAQEISPDAYSGLRWRFLGTHRGGRITAVAGIPGQPNIYYAGTPNGGVWKTDDAGRTWKPIFDAVHVASIGAIAVAPSNANIIYVATGEQGKGRGVF